MKLSENRWLFGLAGIIIIFTASIGYFASDHSAPLDHPWDGVPKRAAHVDHSKLLTGPFKTGQEVTKACKQCHEDSADQVIHTAHWKWESEPVLLEGRQSPITTGKKHSINNFCIGIQGNWEGCTSCHAGYGWDSADFDFSDTSNVDCLVCHDQSGFYKKGKAGLPKEGVDLLAAAKSVGIASRTNCGGCHFQGGGGDAVKHGDLDNTLFYPSDDLDVHMGRYDFICIDCHKTKDHEISGRSITVSLDNKNQIACTDCHNNKLHADPRINAHTDTVACQTCHIPAVARKEATKTHWDWSKAGDPQREESTHEYLKIKGAFIYEKNLIPDYAWFNGYSDRYIRGDKLDPTVETPLDLPKGSVKDPTAKIWPFKIHHSIQPYDTQLKHLLFPKTVGKGGYWTEFDWDKSLRLGAETSGIPFSGSYGFTKTSMYWPQTHMVAPKTAALQCKACHSPGGRMDWEALGYPGDPVKWGRSEREQALEKQTTSTGGSDHHEN